MAARDDRADDPNEIEPPGDGGPVEAAQFISNSVSELADLSRRHGLDVLAHLLEMARLEAEDAARRGLRLKLS